MIFISRAKQEFPLGNSEGDQHRAQTKVPRPQRPLTPYTYVNGRVMMTLAVTLVWKF